MSESAHRTKYPADPPARRGPSLVLCVLAFAMAGSTVYWAGAKRQARTSPATAYTATVRVSYQVDPADSSPISPSGQSPSRSEFRGFDPRQVSALAQTYAQDCRQQWRQSVEQRYLRARDATETARREWVAARARLDAFLEQQTGSAATPAQGVQAPTETPKASTAPRASAENQAPTGDQDPTEGKVRPPAHTPETGTVDDLPELEQGGDQVIDGTETTPPAFQVGSDRLPARAPVASKETAIDQSPGNERPDRPTLERRLATLRGQRESLLTTRTPAHPEVQDVELRIAGLEQQLATLPAQAPVAAPPLPPTVAPSPAAVAGGPELAVAAQQRAERLRELNELRQAVNQTGQAYAEAVEAERAALRQYQREPKIEVEQARAIEPPRQSGPPTRLLLVALVAGLAAAGGLGMISSGAAIEPVVGSVDQAERLLRAPLLGVIPGTESDAAARRASRRSSWARLALLAGGLVLIVCFAAAAAETWGGSL